MKITKKEIKNLIKEEIKNIVNEGGMAGHFHRVPMGFTAADRLPKSQSELGPYMRWTQSKYYRPNSWNQNNGTIVVADSQGKAHVWIPKPDPDAPRRVSYDQAIAALEKEGFSRNPDIPVPYSNFGFDSQLEENQLHTSTKKKYLTRLIKNVTLLNK
tara:strand:+ start:1467 stop:1937 length:471 start_codon:yes stop_codon:yes gene_type:complete